MKLIHPNRRLWLVAAAIAVLCGIAAWRLSATAQAHRDTGKEAAGLANGRERGHAPGTGRFRIQPGGPMLRSWCFVGRAGLEGSPLRVVPFSGPRPGLPDCTEHPCTLLIGRKARGLELFGGSWSEVGPRKPPGDRRGCGFQPLRPGWAVPLGGR